MLAKYIPLRGERRAGMLREWFNLGTGWAYSSRKSQLLRIQSGEKSGLILVRAAANLVSISCWLICIYSWSGVT